MTFTRNTIRTIARNAGRVPKEQMARDLSLPVSLIERVAREQGIDLRLRVAPPDARDLPTLTAYDVRLRGHREPSGEVRRRAITFWLTQGDFEAIEIRAAELGVRRARVITRAIENAIRRGMLADITVLPAPMATHSVREDT
jgi:hypothetical protein